MHIYSHPWYKQLQFSNLEELAAFDKTELLAADVISITGKVEGGIYHSASAEWWGDVGAITTPNDFFRSKKVRKAMPKNIEYFTSQGYTIATIPLTLERYDEFKQLYEETTLKKDRAVYYDLEGELHSKILVDKPTYVCGLFEGEKMISALAFIIESKGAVARVLFGAKKTFDILGGVGGVLEHALIQFCLEQKIPNICHGLSKNPAGLNSHAGVFEFKARHGFTAYPAKYWQTSFVVNPDVALSDLVYVSMSDNNVEYIVITDQDPSQIANKYNARHINTITVLTKDEVKATAAQFLEQYQ
jgi:hypothetical protein